MQILWSTDVYIAVTVKTIIFDNLGIIYITMVLRLSCLGNGEWVIVV